MDGGGAVRDRRNKLRLLRVTHIPVQALKRGAAGLQGRGTGSQLTTSGGGLGVFAVLRRPLL